MRATIYSRQRLAIQPAMSRAEFHRGYSRVLAAWYRLPAAMQSEFREFQMRLHTELAAWQPGQPQPDWRAYGVEVSAICIKYLKTDLFAEVGHD